MSAVDPCCCHMYCLPVQTVCQTHILEVICCTLAPQAGGIFLDDNPAGAFSRGEWARAVAMVSQEPVLFSGTIADNIAYGR